MCGGSDGCLTPHSAVLTPTPGPSQDTPGSSSGSGGGKDGSGLVFNFDDLLSASPLTKPGVGSPGLIVSPSGGSTGGGGGSGSLALPQGLWTGNSNPFE